ncbi:transcriptional regulator, AsnC family [Streptomyces sp. DvalAA-14]|uniref:Lrp/AsnC family transcriptional regulator n=1 Tax=unclassified Streptomyces TaxID=2593676 RepID=UPI00081BB0C8|nr:MULTISPECIES: Lrp/AsnC family transcriptional regulator [unclassified Streptomyces]MYS22943.1 AsnC family transcriptional regulator [Streptomyces sp. SID4948]SCE24944.1 transcriptional regulator, AsnC family [Streptomyces sp. DvalAA-14]
MSPPAPADRVLTAEDQRLVAALQCDGRLGAEAAGEALGISPRRVRLRWKALLGDGTVRVVVPAAPGPDGLGAQLLRIRVLRGKLDTITAALAAREDIPFIDVTTAGDEILAVAWTRPGSRDPLVFRQLPSTQAVTAVEAATVLRVFRLATQWRHDVLTAAERSALTPPFTPARGDLDDTDRTLLAALADDARLPATTLAHRTGLPQSTVRRRLAALTAEGGLVTQVVVDPRRLGLAVDASVMLRVPPDFLDAAGRRLAKHPAVHGAFATSGAANLYAAVWVRDLAALYAFLAEDLTGLGITHTETAIISHPVKRPGDRPGADRTPSHHRPSHRTPPGQPPP